MADIFKIVLKKLDGVMPGGWAPGGIISTQEMPNLGVVVQGSPETFDPSSLQPLADRGHKKKRISIPSSRNLFNQRDL